MDGSVVLVAHGCFRQQGKVLLRNLEEFQIPYDEVISGFTDSFVASQKLVPSAECHSLEGMLRQLGLAWEEVDDAVEKAHDVRRVCQVSTKQKSLNAEYEIWRTLSDINTLIRNAGIQKYKIQGDFLNWSRPEKF